MDFIENTNLLLGINERNLKYIRKNNLPSSKRIADDKLLTKRVLAKNGIETPVLLGKIRNFEELDNFNFSKLPDSVVLKPKHGFGGEGIVVFFSRDKNGYWVKADKSRYSVKDIKNHILGILEGNFSLKNQPDTAFFEERVLMHPDFKKYSYRGIPDIRVIVYNNVPVMAMLRLPTKESDGKANYHAGGICVGIDMASGVTTYAVQHDKYIHEHPDMGTNLRGIKIPFWNKVLDTAVKCQLYSGLGYVGVDIVVDRIKGPLILELNARPGLGIQLANRDGLKGRLERVSGLKITTIDRGIKVAKNLFGGEIEEEIEEVSGKQMIGFVEYAEIHGINGIDQKIKVRNDSGALWSSIDTSLATVLGFDGVMEEFDSFVKEHPFSSLKEGRKVKLLAERKFEDHEIITDIALVKQSTGLDLRPIVRVPFVMSGVKQTGKFTITNRSDMLYDAIIGRKNLKDFLLDPSKKFLG